MRPNVPIGGHARGGEERPLDRLDVGRRDDELADLVALLDRRGDWPVIGDRYLQVAARAARQGYR